MANTYRVRYEGTGITGEIILGVYNGTTDKKVKIYRASCVPLCAYNAVPKVHICTTTAIAGGEDIDTDFLTKMDSTASDLPSQVIIRKNSRGTLGSDFQGGHPYIMTLSNAANARLLAAVGGANWPDFNAGKRYDGGFNSSVQLLRLREGEGIALVMKDVNKATYVRDFHIIFKISTSMYSLWARGISTTGNGDEELVHIFNGSGSGVIIDIVEINCYVPGNTLTGRYGFGKFARKLDIGAALALTPTKMDTSNPDLPANVKCYKHVIFGSAPEKTGRCIQPYVASSTMYDMTQRYASTNNFMYFQPFASAIGSGRSVGGLGALTESHPYMNLFDATINGKPIAVLNEELVGFFAPTWFGDVTGLRCEFEIEFTIEDIPPEPSGSNAAPRPQYGMGYG